MAPQPKSQKLFREHMKQRTQGKKLFNNTMFKNFIIMALTLLMTGGQCDDTEIFVEEGSQAVLPCKCSSSSLHSISVTWSKANKGTVWRKEKSGLQYWGASWSNKGSQGTRIRCPHSQFEKGDCSLQINDVTEEDGGIYSCILGNGKQGVEKVVVLRIMKVAVNSPVPIWGTDVSLTCKVTPWPYGSSVQWMLNNKLWRQTTIVSGKDTASSAVMEKATDRLTGNWTCVVKFKGKEGRASALVSVKGIIQPSEDNTKVYAAVGSAAVLPCVFSTYLAPSLPVWEKLKPVPSRLPASFSTTFKSPWDRSATLNEVMFDDEGSYRCSGTVQGQRQTRTMQLVVAKIDSNIMSKKKRSVTLTCHLSDTREVINYEWVHVTYDLNGTQSVKSIQKGKTPSISEVSEQAQGEWTCRFYGEQGILGNVTHHIQLMSGLSGEKSAGPSYSTAAVVTLSFLLLVLLLILAQMYRNYLRRKRIHQYPALETIVHTISNEREEREKSRIKK